MEGEGGGIVMVGRAEIDTRAPFRSVKEAVRLFGERVLAAEVYAPKLHEVRTAAIYKKEQELSRISSIMFEPEGTKQRMEKDRDKDREESVVLMANDLRALQEELQKTREELQQLKAREAGQQTAAVGCDDKGMIKLVKESDPKQGIVEPETPAGRGDERPHDVMKRRYVKFANPPSTLLQARTGEMTAPLNRQLTAEKMNSTSSSSSKKKKPLIPMLGSMFSKKKGHKEVTLLA